MASLSEIDGEHFEYSGESLWSKFTSKAQNCGSNVALVCTHQPKGHLDLANVDLDDGQFQENPYLRLDYRHLTEAIQTFANALLERGAKPGTPVISLMPNVVELGISLWATIKLGCTWVPINPRNLTNKKEATHMIQTALSWKSSQSAIVLAGDAAIADSLDALDIHCAFTKIIVSTERRNGWENFSDVLHSAPKSCPEDPSLETSLGQAPHTILFTSGTTSLPKGVAMSTQTYAYLIEAWTIRNRHSPTDAICINAPNNHAMGIIWYLLGHTQGITLVHPGPTFHPQVMMETMIRESCTHASMVPTMVHALLGVKIKGGGKITSLKQINLGGAMVSPEIIKMCKDGLGAQDVTNAWGMTEGCVTTPMGMSAEKLVSGNEVSVGFPQSGCRVRVCAPDSRSPLPRGNVGELHYSGPTVATGYIGKESSDFYHDDDGRQWFITGDQASIDDQGRIFITGRYKEMIIRGGENIAPAAIEAILMQDPKIMTLNVQIVGAKDSLAGEVPVAVYKGKFDIDAAQSIQQTVLSRMGSAHVPDQVIALNDLGMDDYPRTMAGKIKKTELTAKVQAFRDQETNSAINGSHSDNELADLVKKIWKRALGYDVDENLSFASFADSITVMKTRDMIAKETGRQITLADMVEANNIAGQIEMLQQQQQQPHQSLEVQRPKKKQRKGPVTADDVVVFQRDPSAFPKSKAFIELMLTRYKLNWDDVIDITPTYDFSSVLNQTGIMDTWSITLATKTKSDDPQFVRGAIRKTLANNPIFTSFLVWNHSAFKCDSALHIIIRQTDEFLDTCIHDFGTVAKVEDVKALAESYPIKNAAVVPGPLFDAGYVYIEETKTLAIVMVLHHAIMDASCSQIFLEDLENALGSKPLVEHISYKTWADSYYSLRTSLEAQVATRWHVNKLKGLSSHRKVFWFDTKAPRAREEAIETSFNIPDILKLRQTHPEISAPIILKTAFTLMCTHRSKHSHALFSNLQASRDQFPFIPTSLKDLGHDFSAADVAGPTIEAVTNLIKVNLDESVLDFLQRMQSDQDNLTKYAAAPLQDIINNLGETDGPLVLETLQASIFNWVPGWGARSSNTYDNMESIAMVARPDNAFVINAGLGGERGCTMYMFFPGTAMTKNEHLGVAGEIERITRWIVDERNWDRGVGGFEEVFV